MKIRFALSVGVVASVVLGACSSSESSKPAASIPAGALEVDAGPGLKWGQDAYTAAAGTVTVAMVNRDSQLHSLVIVDGKKKPQGPELEVRTSGDVDTGTFTLAPGEYQILCLVPGHNNMKATLTVG